MRVASLPRLLLLTVLAAACTDTSLPTASTPPEPGGGEILASLQCSVTVRTGELQCRDAAPSLGGSAIILGGQGVYVRLANTGTHYDSVTGIFRTDVTVENLTAQPLGTPDGIQTWAFRVFFSSGPTTTSGSGGVEVANPDGVATFTAVGQPFFLYPEIIGPQVVSHARPWEFRVDAGVEAFTFGVLVQGDIPDPGGILRWVPRLSMDGPIGTRRSTTAGSTVFIAWERSGGRTDILRSDDGGTTWTESWLFADTTGSGCGSPPVGVYLEIIALWAADPSTLYAVENRYIFCSPTNPSRLVTGLLRSVDGGRTWARLLNGHALMDGVELWGIWGSASGDLYLSGNERTTGSGILLHSNDGFQTYGTQHFPRRLGRVWGRGSDDLFLISYSLNGDMAAIHHSMDGGATWSEWPVYGWGVTGIWGLGDQLWAVGQTRWTYRSVAMRSTDGGMTWGEPEILPGAGLSNVWGTTADNVYAAGDQILRYDGDQWRLMDPWWKTSIGWPYVAEILAVTDQNHVIIGGGQAVVQGVR